MIGATTAVVQDTRVCKKDGTYAIKLRITYDREQKYFPLGKFLTKEDWKILKSGKHRNKELKELKIHLSGIENKAVKIIDKMEHFTFAEFLNLFNGKPQNKSSVIEALKARLKELTKKERYSTAITFQYTIKAIEDYLKFLKRKKLTFSSITPDWLQSFEEWMIANKKSNTTAGIYLRNLRTILNQAIEDGLLPRENYPFSKNKYQIPSARNTKKALAISDIKKFIDYTPKTDAEERAKDLWLFSYLCNGVNIKDMARLKYKNLDFKRISFVRAKTERSTKANQKPIVVIRIPEINEIIKKWGNKNTSPEDYVFPILSEQDTPEQEYAKIQQATKTINKYTKRIGKELGFELTLTTYTARHSFATVLKRSGAPVVFISESLGHSSLKTTESYLDTFEDDTKESYQRKLLDF
ncbi:MAG: site-specific integrase [Carboxylicivirga sp.]|jgi:integrase|nr:site-specific integrase [Carboxylicivirga sp.]